MGNDGGPTFQYQGHGVGGGKLPGDTLSIGFDLRDTLSYETGHLTGMRSQHQQSSPPVQDAGMCSEGVERIGVDDHGDLRLLEEAEEEFHRLLLLAPTGADRDHRFLFENRI